MSSTVTTDLLSTTWPDVSDPPLPNASHLCHHCRSMGHKIRQLCEVKESTVTKPWVLVKKSSSTCAFCRLIASACSRDTCKSEGDFIIHNKGGGRDYFSRPDDGIDELIIEHEGTYHLVKLVVFTTEGSLPATANHVSGRCIKDASDLSRASAWLNDCVNNHNHGPKEAATRPSRLVAVGTVDGSEPIKIVDDSNPGDEYLALSYCWGKSGTLRTTAETLDTFRNSIPWNQLPKTFQDAIQIARELGIGYIWIDSLCIIQDNKDDWETESARMADIYNGALLTIMAAAASHSHGGCFQDRVATKEMVALPYTDASGTTELSVFVSPESVLLGYERVVFAGPLFRRGWVFQERLMSKRKLNSGEDQTYWECSSVVLSESEIESRDKFAAIHRYRNNSFRTFPIPSYQLDGPEGEKTWAALWTDLVYEYSHCSLTYDTDRLPSLSGLARTFGQKSGGSYAAGLWQDQMPYSLAWYVSYTPGETCKRNYCAPSWSWASTLGPINFRPHHDNFELEVISTDIKLAGRDPYGKVEPGSSMCVRGRLRAGMVVKKEENNPRRVVLETEDGRRRGWGFLDGDGKDLPLDITSLEVSSVGDGWAVCLFLQRTEKDGQFQRLGMADVDSVGQDEDYLFYGLEKQVIELV